MTFETEITILESHLDTFGHVNNAVYLSLFEQARWEIIQSRGYGLKRVQELRIGPTILEVNLKFQRELRLREKVKIVTHSDPARGKIFVIHQKMLNAKGEDACVASFTMGLLDLNQRKLVEPTPEWLHALGQAQAKLS